MPADDVKTMLSQLGFVSIQVDEKEQSKEVIATWMPGSGAEDFVVSANISAVKPRKSAPSNATAPTAPCNPSSSSSSSSKCCAPAAPGSKKEKARRK